MAFTKQLELKGIPHKSNNPSETYIYQAISEISQLYPLHDSSPPALADFYISLAVIPKQTKSLKSLDDPSTRLWSLANGLAAMKDKDPEIGFFYNFFNGVWDTAAFVFFLKCRRLILQFKQGDRPRPVSRLKDFSLDTNEWVQLAARLFNSAFKPTACVQRISSRLFDTEFTKAIPAVVFTEICLSEFHELPGKTDKPPKKNGPVKSLFAEKPPKLPPRPANIDIMQYGKKTPPPALFNDEELHLAVAEEKEDIQEHRTHICEENDTIKEKLQEKIQECDTLAYEHDLLLTQNHKLKMILSIVTDKLIDIDPALVADIDFTDIVNDPCRDIRPFAAAIPDVKDTLFDIPLIEEPKLSTPKFTKHTGFDEDVFVSQFVYEPDQEGLLNIEEGDVIKKISQLDDWVFGENVRTGVRGFFPNSILITDL